MHFLARRAVVWFSPPKAAYKMAPPRAPTSPAGTVSQPIGKPFNGQAKGLLWLTWRSYAGPPQYYIPPEGKSPQPACKAKPITDRTLGAQGQRPGGWLNPHARKGVSTFRNTGKHRPSPGPGPDPDRAERHLNPPAFEHTLSHPHISHISHIKSRHRNACFSLKERCFSIKRKEPTCRL